MNLVQTLLALEELDPGDLLEVTLEGREAMSNVPRSLKQSGTHHRER
ncbi:MAG: sulfurtransferase TusA family protein [Dehalococcoidia bacterium]|nr:sulfurtransferase TusA family protein [Dehalococcoidia bacterium]